MAKQMKMEGFSDHENYRRMREPYPSVDAANESLQKFSEAVYEIRNKHRIAECTVIMSIPVIDERGDEGEAMLAWHFGDSSRELPNLARAYGKAQAEYEDKLRLYEQMGRVDTKKHKAKAGDIRVTGEKD